MMKWIFLLPTICVCPLVADESTASEGQKEKTVLEDRIQRLEQDVGLEVAPKKTTVFLSGQFIYWKTSLDGVAYATTAEVVSVPGGGTINDEFKTRTVHFDYDPAFQIGVGLGLPHDFWDLSLAWLHSNTKGHDTAHGTLSATPGNRVILDQIGLIEQLDSPPSIAKADCKVHLDIVDAVLGRTFLWSRYFIFRPFAGLRGAWLSLDWDISYKMPIRIPSPTVQSYTKFDVDNDYSAYGFVGGFDAKWNFYKELGVFSHASASLVYGESTEKTKQKFYRIPANQTATAEQTLKAHNSTHAVKGIFDIALGLKWEIDFYKTNRLLMWIGYDFFYWPNVTQKTINQQTRSRDRADLSYQGLIAGAKVIF